MRALNVLKKLYLLSRSIYTIIFFTTFLLGDDLSSVLSSDKNRLLEYKSEQNSEQVSQVEKSWINPIRLQYSKNYSSQYPNTIGFVVFHDLPQMCCDGCGLWWDVVQGDIAVGYLVQGNIVEGCNVQEPEQSSYFYRGL